MARAGCPPLIENSRLILPSCSLVVRRQYRSASVTNSAPRPDCYPAGPSNYIQGAFHTINLSIGPVAALWPHDVGGAAADDPSVSYASHSKTFAPAPRGWQGNRPDNWENGFHWKPLIRKGRVGGGILRTTRTTNTGTAWIRTETRRGETARAASWMRTK